MAMPWLALGRDPVGGHVERGKEGGGAVTGIAVCDALDVSESEGEEGSGALERLDPVRISTKSNADSDRCRNPHPDPRRAPGVPSFPVAEFAEPAYGHRDGSRPRRSDPSRRILLLP